MHFKQRNQSVCWRSSAYYEIIKFLNYFNISSYSNLFLIFQKKTQISCHFQLLLLLRTQCLSQLNWSNQKNSSPFFFLPPPSGLTPLLANKKNIYRQKSQLYERISLRAVSLKRSCPSKPLCLKQALAIC